MPVRSVGLPDAVTDWVRFIWTIFVQGCPIPG
jgi:hypothetical protein